MFIEYYFYYFYYTFWGFPFIIRVAVLVITIFIPLFILLLFVFARIRNHYSSKEKLGKNIKDRYEDRIRHIMTTKEIYLRDDIHEIMRCNVGKLSGKKRKTFTNEILGIYQSGKNINESNYRTLIDYLELQPYWERKIKSGTISSRLRALRKLDDFNIEMTGVVIASLTNSRNRFLRKRARSYYMHLSKNSPYKFLNEDFDRTFNDWDKIELHQVLSEKAEEGLPNLTQWIKNSNNTAFKCFLVDEIKYLGQKEGCQYLLEILDTPDIELRKHCIGTLGELKCVKAEKELIRSYTQQPVIIQQSIIRTIQKLYTGEALSFLEDAYLGAHDSETKMLTLYAIYNYGPAGRKLFDSLRMNVKGFPQLMFDHVSNELLQSQLAIV